MKRYPFPCIVESSPPISNDSCSLAGRLLGLHSMAHSLQAGRLLGSHSMVHPLQVEQEVAGHYCYYPGVELLERLPVYMRWQQQGLEV